MGTGRELARIMRGGAFTGHSDRSLLARFAEGDAAAFEALLLRHGPHVLNICRKLLADRHEVEDAFQATFLVLVRSARSIRTAGDGSLSPWLCTVAYRVAQRARTRRIRRVARERPFDSIPEAVDARPDRDSHPSLREAAAAIHEELALLPDRLRTAIVCCYLDGLTHEAAAARLGWPVGTVRSRLARARARLRDRLSRRGLAPGDADLALLLARPIELTVPDSLARATVSLVTNPLTCTAGASVAPASVLELVKGVLMPMVLRKTTLAALMTLPLIALVFAGVALAFPQDGAAPASRSPLPRSVSRPVDQPDATTYPVAYYVGDLLLRPADLPKDGQQPRVDMVPLIRIIRSTIAPGTWKLQDGSDSEARVEEVVESGLAEKQGKDPSPGHKVGRIIPFYLSISLIISQTAEVHEQIATLLSCLRKYRQHLDASPGPSPDSIPLSGLKKMHVEELKRLIEDVRRKLDLLEPPGRDATKSRP